MAKKPGTDWTLIPGTHKDIEHVRDKCRRLVRRRALISAGVSAIPIPGVDVVSDLSLFALLVDDINSEFGLTPQQVARMQPRYRLVAYQAAVGLSSMMVGRVLTREVVVELLKRVGLKSMARMGAGLVPVAGQVASAVIGFTVFRTMGYQHVDACALMAQELMGARAK